MEKTIREVKRVLVLGSAGMAGHVIRKHLIDSGKYIVGEVARTVPNAIWSYSVDVTDIQRLDEVLSDFNPDIVVNCIGVLNNFAESDPERAVFLNSFLPHHLAKEAIALKFRLIHISTDCVFSGLKGNYADSDIRDGKGIYAESKALGEVFYGDHLTVRTSIIGPELNTHGIGLLHWFLKNESNQVKGYTMAFWGGVTTIQLAIAIEKAIDHQIGGLVHLTNGLKISKFDLLSIFKEVFKKDVILRPDDKYRVDKSLAVSLQTRYLGEVPSYEEMILNMKLWMMENRDLYTQNYNY